MGVAMRNDSIEVVQLLLELGASTIEQEPIRQSASGAFGGGTPLHDAIRTGSAKIVKLLLSRGADLDIQDAQGLSPHIAQCSTSRYSCLQFEKWQRIGRAAAWLVARILT